MSYLKLILKNQKKIVLGEARGREKERRMMIKIWGKVDIWGIWVKGV